ncbi:MAG: flippase [Candidatus Altiarchaeota archaeon]
MKGFRPGKSKTYPMVFDMRDLVLGGDADSTPVRDVMLKSGAILFLMYVLMKITGYFFNILFVKYLSQESYGNFTYLWSLAMALTGLLAFEIGGSAQRYIAFYRGEGSMEKVRSTYKTGLLISSFILVLSTPLLILTHKLGFFGIDDYRFLFVFSLYAMHSISQYFLGVFGGFRRPELSAFFGLLISVFKVVAIVVVVLLGYSYLKLLGILLVLFLIYSLSSIAYCIRLYGFGGEFQKDIVPPLMKFGFSLILVTTSMNLLAWGDIFLIKYYMGDSSVAVYNVAWLVSSASLIFFFSVTDIFRPIVTEFLGGKDFSRASRTSSYILESFFLLFMPIFVVILFFSREIIFIFFTPDYIEGVVPLQILSVGVFLFGVSILYKELFSACGKPHLNALILGSGAVVNIASNYILIPLMGLTGAAYSTLFSSGFILASSCIVLRRELGMISLKPSSIRLSKIIFSSAIMILPILMIKPFFVNPLLSIAAPLSLAALLYATALLVSKSFSSMDFEMMEMFLGKMGFDGRIKKFLLWVVSMGVSN